MLRLRQQLQRDEGLRLKPYLDCCGKYWRNCQCERKGKLTIGYGRNLDDYGVTRQESEVMLDNDINRNEADVLTWFPWSAGFHETTVGVLINMAFNMGVGGLKTFTKMLRALRAGDREEAARQLLDSKYAKQVGERADRLAEQLKTQVWQ